MASAAFSSLRVADTSNPGEEIANLVGDDWGGGGDGGGGAGKWICALLGGDGMIYCLPDAAPRVLRIECTHAGGVLASAIGADYGAGSFKWAHGVVAAPVPPARYGVIYGIPCNASRVLRIDPNTGTTSLIGQAYGSSEAKWRTGTLANGKIYAVPSNARHVLQIDPLTDTTRLIGGDLGDTWMKWLSCALDGEGNIICSPGQGDKVLRIDPRSEATSLIGGDVYQTRGARTPLMCTVTVKGEKSGLLYGVPRDCRTKGLLQIDPRTGTTSMVAFDEVDATDTNWFTSSLPYGNKEVLCCPTGCHAGAKVVLQIAAPSLMTYWATGVRGKDGFVYGLPGSAGRILRINSNEGTSELIGPDFGASRHRFSSNWMGCAMCPRGTILCPPYAANRVLQIDASRWKCVRHLVLLREMVRVGYAEAVEDGGDNGCNPSKGDTVKVKELVKAAQYNALEGVISTALDPETNRCGVRVEYEGKIKTLALQTKNLVLLHKANVQPSTELSNELEDVKHFLLMQLEDRSNAYSKEAVEEWGKHIRGFNVPSPPTSSSHDDISGVCSFIFQPELLSDDCFYHIVKFV